MPCDISRLDQEKNACLQIILGCHQIPKAINLYFYIVRLSMLNAEKQLRLCICIHVSSHALCKIQLDTKYQRDNYLANTNWNFSGFRNYVAQQSSIHLQEEDNYMSIQIAEEDKGSLAFKMQITQNDNDDIKTQETENNNIAEETLIYGLEYPICKQCGNGRQKNVSVREFTYAELYTATYGFSKKHFLSKGGFGSVYRGTLTDGQCIAVKQYKHASSQGETEFRSEVHVLGTLQHKNVVMLLGSCSEGNHRLLVYEYVCNGSLNQHLSSKIWFTIFVSLLLSDNHIVSVRTFL